MIEKGGNHAVGKGSGNTNYQDRVILCVLHHVDIRDWVESPISEGMKQMATALNSKVIMALQAFGIWTMV